MVTRRLAFYDVRDWVTSDPRLSQLLNINGGIVPIFPAASNPESVLPYIRYDIDRSISTNKWWIHSEAVILDIFTEDVEDANEIVNIFIDYLSQGDDSARELERWILQEQKQKDFEFHSIEFFSGGEFQAPEEQGGKIARSIAFVLHYSPLQGRLISSD
jgi:hypothetical protein